MQNLIVEESYSLNSAQWYSIFNHPSYFELHQTPSSVYFSLYDELSKTLLAVCHFTEIESGIFKSPSRGTFAGPEFKEINIEHQIYFIKRIEERLKEKGAKKIILSTAPFQHSPDHSATLFNTLINDGYIVSSHDLNYGVSVDDEEFIDKIKYNNKKRLKKCIRENFKFEICSDRVSYEEAYNIISENRQSKGYPVTMTFEQIMKMKEIFPQNVYFFKITTNGKGAAASICIRLSENVLYVFYWGDRPGFEQYSPVVLLANGIYNLAKEIGVKMLDAGTSTLAGQPNMGLVKFKENLGMNASLKLTYSKALI